MDNPKGSTSCGLLINVNSIIANPTKFLIYGAFPETGKEDKIESTLPENVLGHMERFEIYKIIIIPLHNEKVEIRQQFHRQPYQGHWS